MINLSSNKYQTLFEYKDAKFNLSTYFVYPLLDIASYYTKYLEETYLFNDDIESTKPLISLLYKFPQSDCEDGLLENHNFTTLKEYLIKNPNFYCDYIYSFIYKDNPIIQLIKDEYVCFVFKIPVIFQNDYDCFIEGKYSKLSLKAKEKITNKYDKNKWEDLCNIVTKDPKRKRWLEDYLNIVLDQNAELAPLFDKELETLTVNKLI